MSHGMNKIKQVLYAKFSDLETYTEASSPLDRGTSAGDFLRVPFFAPEPKSGKGNGTAIAMVGHCLNVLIIESVKLQLLPNMLRSPCPGGIS